MSENPSTNDVPAPVAGAGVTRLFGTGIAGWLAGMLLLYGVAAWIVKAEPAALALLWVISHSWIAYLVGLGVMIILGLATSRAELAKPLLAYALPAALLAGLAAISLAVYPDATLRSDFLTFLPVILVFYIAGWAWMKLQKTPANGPSALRAVIPCLLGGLLIFGMIAVPAFASDAFRYRSAFQLKTGSMSAHDGVFVYDGTLQVTKPGNYRFAAPRHVYGIDDAGYEQAELELGEIQWGAAGSPENGGQGSFPLRITWKRILQPVHNVGMFSYDGAVIIEVYNADENDRLVHSLVADLQDIE